MFKRTAEELVAAHPRLRLPKQGMGNGIEDVVDFATAIARVGGRDAGAVAANLEAAFAAPSLGLDAEGKRRLARRIVDYALDACARPQEVEIWPPGRTRDLRTITYRQHEVRGVLANAFFSNVRDTVEECKSSAHKGGIDFGNILATDHPVAVRWAVASPSGAERTRGSFNFTF